MRLIEPYPPVDGCRIRLLSVSGAAFVEIDPAYPEAIRTVRGVGYMFVLPKD